MTVHANGVVHESFGISLSSCTQDIVCHVTVS